MNRRKVLALATIALAWAGLAHAAPRGTVIVKRTQQEFNNVEWEVRGDRVEVKLPFGSRFFRLGDLLLVPVTEGASSSGDDSQGAGAASATAWHARCRLIPLAGWEPVTPSVPTRLVELLHRSGARLAVSLIPVEGDFDLDSKPGRGASGLGDWVSQDLHLSFHGFRSAAAKTTELFGSRVVSVGPMAVSPVGWPQKLTLKQVRFRRFGFEYVLTLVTPADEEGKQILRQADALFAGFTFLPTVARTHLDYEDFGRGFSIRRPGEDWEMVDRPFSSEEPIRLTIDGGRGELKVTITEAESAAAHVREMLQSRKQKSRYYSAERVQVGQQDGAEVERFQFEDFKAGGRKKLRFKGFSVMLQGRVVTFVGIAPLTDQDARKIQGEIDRTLASIRLYDRQSMSARLGILRDSARKISDGYKALGTKDYSAAEADFDDALQLNEGSALAYYLRGSAKRGLGDFEGFREDLGHAMEIDPEGGFGGELGPSYAEEAEAAEDAEEFLEAIELWGRALKIDSSSEDYTKGLADCLKTWWTKASRDRGLDIHRQLIEIERAAKRYDDESLVIASLASIYKDGANKLARAKSYAKAKRWARKLRSLSGQRATGTKLYDQIKTLEARDRGR